VIHFISLVRIKQTPLPCTALCDMAAADRRASEQASGHGEGYLAVAWTFSGMGSGVLKEHNGINVSISRLLHCDGNAESGSIALASCAYGRDHASS